MKTETQNKANPSERINWLIGTGQSAWSNGYITDFRPARKGSKYPEVGTALYCKTAKNGKVLSSERRAFFSKRWHNEVAFRALVAPSTAPHRADRWNNFLAFRA